MQIFRFYLIWKLRYRYFVSISSWSWDTGILFLSHLEVEIQVFCSYLNLKLRCRYFVSISSGSWDTGILFLSHLEAEIQVFCFYLIWKLRYRYFVSISSWSWDTGILFLFYLIWKLRYKYFGLEATMLSYLLPVCSDSVSVIPTVLNLKNWNLISCWNFVPILSGSWVFPVWWLSSWIFHFQVCTTSVQQLCNRLHRPINMDITTGMSS